METRSAEMIAPGLIDTRLKLHLLLLFIQQPQLCGAVKRLHERLCVNPWDLEESLESLAESGFLTCVDDSERHYQLAACPQLQTLFKQLLAQYDDPLQRDTMYALTRAAEEERVIQIALAVGQEWGDSLTTTSASAQAWSARSITSQRHNRVAQSNLFANN